MVKSRFARGDQAASCSLPTTSLTFAVASTVMQRQPGNSIISKNIWRQSKNHLQVFALTLNVATLFAVRAVLVDCCGRRALAAIGLKKCARRIRDH